MPIFQMKNTIYNALKRQAAYPFLAKHLGLNIHAVLKNGQVDESINTVLTEKDLKVFNDMYPMPQSAIKGNEAILKALSK